MSDEYIDVEDHKRISDEMFIRGQLIGELRRLSDVHQGEPHTLWVLQMVRTMMGDVVK